MLTKSSVNVVADQGQFDNPVLQPYSKEALETQGFHSDEIDALLVPKQLDY